MLINEIDNVEVNILNGHKYAVCDIQKGENIILLNKEDVAADSLPYAD